VQEKDIDADDWTEQDLLTRELALDRLARDATQTAADLAALRAGPHPDPDAVALLERRLRALEESRANVAPW
jgi:hypothetical protein